MRIHHWIAIACGAVLVTGTTVAAGQVGGATPANNANALVKVKSNRFDDVYLRPDTDLHRYTKIMLSPPQVTFAQGWLKDMNSQRITLLQRTTTEDAERIADEVRSGFHADIANAFKRAGYEIVTVPGADVLQLQVSIVDLYINAPESITMSLPSRIYTTNAGQATLAIEMRDSTSDTLLGRIGDHRTAGDRGSFRSSFMRTNPVSNRFDFGSVFQLWALGAVKTLTELKS